MHFAVNKKFFFDFWFEKFSGEFFYRFLPNCSNEKNNAGFRVPEYPLACNSSGWTLDIGQRIGHWTLDKRLDIGHWTLDKGSGNQNKKSGPPLQKNKKMVVFQL